MATIRVKTIQYRCPHCQRELKSTPYNDYCVLGGKIYADPFDTCPWCRQTYRSTFSIEPATELTLAQRVPFFLTDIWFLAVEIAIVIGLVMAAFAGVPELLWGLLAVAVIHAAASAITRPRRQKHKDKLLTESRNRLKDPKNFLREAMAFMGENMKKQLTDAHMLQMYASALADMEADRPVDMCAIICETFGLPKPAKESPREKNLKMLATVIQVIGAILAAVSLIWILTQWYLLGEAVPWVAWVLAAVGAVILIVMPEVTGRIAKKDDK